MLAHRMNESFAPQPFSFQKRWGGLWISLILLSQCTIQTPPQVIVLREGEILVKSGDTVSSLAQEYGVSARSIIDTNHLAPPFSIADRQKLRLPEKDPMVFEEVSMPECAPVEPCLEVEEVNEPSLMPGQEAQDVQWVDIPVDPKPKAHKVVSPSEPKSKPATANKKTPFLAPVEGEIVCHYKQPWKGLKSHGIHYKTSKKTVHAAASGTVMLIAPCYDKIYDQTSGKKLVVIVRHPDRLIGIYGPLETCSVHANQKVTDKTVLGKLQGNILFFQVRKINANNAKNREVIDPEPLIRNR